MPKIMKLPRLFVSISASLAMALTTVLVPASAHAISNPTIAALTNQQRASAGLPALAWNGLLSTSATLKAQDMCAKDYWAHTSPDGLTPWTFMARAGYSYYAAGENLAKGYSSDAGVMNSWMASPTHRDNILSSKYTEIGVASMTCTLQGQTTTLVVAHYGSRGPVSQPQPAAAPAPAKPVQRAPAPAAPRPAAKPAPVTPQPSAQPKITATLGASTPAVPTVVASQPAVPKQRSMLGILKFTEPCKPGTSLAALLAMTLFGANPSCL